MTSILQRNNKINKPIKKTREEYAEDALYREVWEDVNNEKTEQFLKKYWRHIVGAVLAILIAVSAGQLIMRIHNAARVATAVVYEDAIANMDAVALANLAHDKSGATADLALFQAYLIDNDVNKLQELAQHGHTRDFRDLAKIHVAGINGDAMSVADFVKYLESLNTKKSPFFYVSRLMVAQKYLANGDSENANKILDAIISDENAPATISATAQSLK